MITNQLITIGVLFLFAIIGSVLSTRFRQPYVLGLLIVGALIGPNALNIVSDGNVIELMIELGSILFLFVIGLEFSVKELLKTGAKSVLLAFFKMGIMFFLGYVAVIAFGIDPLTAIFIGVIVSFSSTMITVNILKQRGLMKRKEIPLLLAVLIIEDIVGVIFLNVFASIRHAQTSVLNTIEHLIIGLGVLIIVYLIASKFAEQFIRWLSKNTSDEMLMFIGLDLCVGFALLAFILNVSPAAGAFLAGSVVANFKESKSFEKVTKPHSFMFTTLFFIAIGTMINMQAIFQNLLLVILLPIIMIGGMFLSVGLVGKIMAGFDNESAAFGSIAMMPMGIFSLLIAKESIHFNVSADLVTVTSITMFILALFTSEFVTKTRAVATLFPEEKKRNAFALFSHYISSLFEELSTESRYTREFKSGIMKLITECSGIIFLIIIISRIIPWLFTITNMKLVVLVTTGTLFILAWIFILRKQFIRTGELLIDIAAYMDRRGNQRQAKAIIQNGSLGFFLILAGLFQPFTIFLFNLEGYFVLVGVTIIIFGIYFLKRAYTHIKAYAIKKEHSPYHYQKFSALKHLSAKRL